MEQSSLFCRLCFLHVLRMYDVVHTYIDKCTSEPHKYSRILILLRLYSMIGWQSEINFSIFLCTVIYQLIATAIHVR